MTIAVKKTLSIILTILISVILTFITQSLTIFIAARIAVFCFKTFSYFNTTLLITSLFSIIFLICGSIVYLFQLVSTSALAHRIIRAREVRQDWGLFMRLVSATTILITSILTTLILGRTLTFISTLAYVIIYTIFVVYNIMRSKESIKGIKKEKVFK